MCADEEDFISFEEMEKYISDKLEEAGIESAGLPEFLKSLGFIFTVTLTSNAKFHYEVLSKIDACIRWFSVLKDLKINKIISSIKNSKASLRHSVLGLTYEFDGLTITISDKVLSAFSMATVLAIIEISLRMINPVTHQLVFTKEEDFVGIGETLEVYIPLHMVAKKARLEKIWSMLEHSENEFILTILTPEEY